MSALFKKLNLNDHSEIVVLDAPSSLDEEIALLEGVTVRRSLGKTADFVLAFVQRRVQVERLARKLNDKTEGRRDDLVRVPQGHVQALPL